MIANVLISFFLISNADYSVSDNIVKMAPAYQGVNFTEDNLIALDSFIIPRRDTVEGGRGGFIGAIELQATHHVANHVRLKVGLPFVFDFGSDAAGADNVYRLGNVLLGSSFSIPFSSNAGGWDFLFNIGLDARIPTATKDVNAIPSTTRYSLFMKEAFSIFPYAGLYGERDIVSFQVSVGYDILNTDPTAKVIRAQAGIAYHGLDPMKFGFEYNLAKQTDFSIGRADTTLQEISPSVQFIYRDWSFAGFASLFLQDAIDAAYAGGSLRVAYSY